MELCLNRVRIVRNAIHREWQKSPAGSASARGYRLGLRHALQALYSEFPEIERLKDAQKPRCPFCNEEVDHSELAKHMLQHNKNNDKLAGVPVQKVDLVGSWLDRRKK